MINQIFRTDKKYWTQNQCDQVQVFFQFNPFYSKFYQHKDFDKIMTMTFFAKIHKNNPINLENSKRPEAIVLLSGKIDILKKKSRTIGLKKIKNKNKDSNVSIKNEQKEEFYQSIDILSQENQSMIIQSECQLMSLQDKDAQILFIPSILYNQHIKYLQNQKIQVIFKGLRSFFPDIQRKALVNLAKAGCYYKEYRINQFIYRAGDNPQQVYLLLEGNVKLQKPGFSAKKMFQMVILNSNSMFGEKDINLQYRQRNAISCSAYARTLVIPKKQFLKFAKEYLPNIEYLNSDQSTYTLPTLNKNGKSLYLHDKADLKPKFTRFHSSNKLQNQHFIETKLIKNCHILVNLSPKGATTSRLESSNARLKDYSKDQFKQKIRLFKRIRPNSKKVDFQNPMFEWESKRRLSLKSQVENAQD